MRWCSGVVLTLHTLHGDQMFQEEYDAQRTSARQGALVTRKKNAMTVQLVLRKGDDIHLPCASWVKVIVFTHQMRRVVDLPDQQWCPCARWML